jgi:tRNA(Leu) C34 or U34 (ribose-2'-O)-methylase TrmL
MAYDIDQHGLDPSAFVEAADPRGHTKRVKPAVPAVVLTNPKYAHNLAQTVRALSCFGVSQLWWNGERLFQEILDLKRIPREERMRGYSDVSILYHERPLEAYQQAKESFVPVCVELVPGAENLFDFIHPYNAVYVFGPEDGSVHQGTRRNCHRFVHIPTKHCANLSAAVYMVLYDRALKHNLQHLEDSR